MGRLFYYTIVGKGKENEKRRREKNEDFRFDFVFSFEDEKKNGVEEPIVISRLTI